MNFFKGLEKVIVLFLLLVCAKVVSIFVTLIVLTPLRALGVPILSQSVSFIVQNGLPLLVLIFFWKRWNNVGVLISGAVFCSLLILFSLLLTFAPAKDGLAFSNLIFMLALLALPFYLATPFVLVGTLLYARFRGLLKNENALDVEPVVPRDPVKEALISKHKKWVAIAFALVALIPVFLTIRFFTQPERTSEPVVDSALVGQKIVFGKPMYYSRNCTRCGGSPRDLEINRDLECLNDGNGLSGYLYKDGYMDIEYVPSTTEFTVVEEFGVEAHGMASIGGGGYNLVVLKDPQGNLSTTLALRVEDKSICTNDHIAHPETDPLFAYIEQAGKLTVIANLYNYSLRSSAPEMQDEFIAKLPEKYKKGISNVEKIPTPYKNLYGVRLTVDSDALAFLAEAELDLKIFSLYGDDPVFQEWLKTQEEGAYTGGSKPQENSAAHNFSYAPTIAATPRVVGGSLDMDAIVDPGKSIHVRSVGMPVPGFLVIYQMGGFDSVNKIQKPDKIFGVSELLPIGVKQNFDVPLTEEVGCISGIVARLYIDVDNDGKYDSSKEKDWDGSAWIYDAEYNLSVTKSLEVKCR